MSPESTVKVAVTGATGYAGGEILRLLLQHQCVSIGALTAGSSAGSALSEHQPHLVTLADRRVVDTTVENLRGHDVVFLALPHGASAQIAADLPAEVLVIDCGADHRLERRGDWLEYYGGEHAGTWPYGLPELITGPAGSRQRAELDQVRRIAVPGCNVTAVTLGLQPAIADGLVESTDLVAVLANGYSGAGRTVKRHLLAAESLGSAAPYAVGGTHRHIPEIAQNLRHAGADQVSLSFTPTLVPMARGILATTTARLRSEPDTDAVRASYQRWYDDEPFVQLLADGQWPTTASVLGTNSAHIGITIDRNAGRLTTVTAIDNLGKGTAGGAIQSMNLALGLPETMGLPVIGVAP